MAKISIIIPCYKVEAYLPKCLDSLINQTYKNLEIICIDDGSPDNSGKILDEYAKKDSRIKVIHQGNGGVSSARNTGLDIATGEWISFVDADDWLDVNAYEKLLNSTEDEKVEMLVFGNHSVCDGVISKYKSINANESNFTDYSYLLLRLGGVVWNKLFSRSLIEENKTRFVKGINLSEDGLFNTEIMLKYPKLKIVDEGIYFYRIYRPDSTLSGQHSLDKELSIRDYLCEQEFYKKATIEERIAMDIKILNNLIYRYERLSSDNKIKNINFLQEYEFYLRKAYSAKELSQFKQVKQVRKLIKLNGREESLASRIFSIKNSKDKTKKIICFLGFKFQVNNNLISEIKESKK